MHTVSQGIQRQCPRRHSLACGSSIDTQGVGFCEFGQCIIADVVWPVIAC